VTAGQDEPRRRGARVGKADWISAGLALLAERGVDAVAVEPLCLRLGVTKGSFYWHFADRAALHAAMLESWRRTGTTDVADRVEEAGGGPHQKLARLTSLAAANPRAGLEVALRAWARRDPAAAAAVAEVDAIRTAYVAGLLVQMGLRPATAMRRSRLIYLVLLGGYLVEGSSGGLAGADIWAEVLRLVRVRLPAEGEPG